MRSLKLDFANAGTTLDLDSVVEGKDATIQASLINSIVERGSDAMHPLKGTDLRKTIMSGGVVDWASASHASNFAAAATVDFMGVFEDDAPAMESLTLFVIALGGDLVELSAGFTFNDGTSIGVSKSTEI